MRRFTREQITRVLPEVTAGEWARFGDLLFDGVNAVLHVERCLLNGITCNGDAGTLAEADLRLALAVLDYLAVMGGTGQEFVTVWRERLRQILKQLAP